MYLEATCVGISQSKWDALMKGNRPCSKQKACSAALEVGILNEQDYRLEIKQPWYNPYQHRQTKTHIIYIHSGIEHFIRK